MLVWRLTYFSIKTADQKWADVSARVDKTISLTISIDCQTDRLQKYDRINKRQFKEALLVSCQIERFDINPSLLTSSTKVRAPYLCATSHSSSNGHTSPVMECTVSNATIFGTSGSACSRSCSRCSTSLWRKINFFAPLLRMPWIMEAWLPESEKIRQPATGIVVQHF